MRIIVCIKEVIDSKLNLGFGRVNEELLQKGLARRLNPTDAEALANALRLKEIDENVQVEITVISIGPERVECYLRDGLALGADRVVRIWEEDLKELSPWQKAKLLSKAISLFDADLILTGAKSMDNATGQVGPLIAAWLGLPCVGEVVRLELAEEQKSIILTRDIGRGAQENVQCSLPAVITVKEEGERFPYASLDKLLESQYSEIVRLTLADLDMSPAELRNDPTKVTGLAYPRPRPKKAPMPDSSLPAFDRILKLLEGGISRRQGTMLQGSSEELVEQLFKLLVAEGMIQSATEQGDAGK
ncbi:electron transfer flavoprotein subunit beta/FixA family protein [Chloroflexota bacterium]